MQFNEFLQLTKVIRMLYGHEFALKFFENNIHQYEKIVDINILIDYYKPNTSTTNIKEKV